VIIPSRTRVIFDPSGRAYSTCPICIESPSLLPRSLNQKPPVLSNTMSFGPRNFLPSHWSYTVFTAPDFKSTRWIEPVL
jgi:hypothetical protein